MGGERGHGSGHDEKRRDAESRRLGWRFSRGAALLRGARSMLHAVVQGPEQPAALPPRVIRAERWHRLITQHDDVRLVARAPTRELCIAEAALAAVTGFVDTTSVRKVRTCRYRLHGSSDEDVLVAVLNKVIYLVDTAREVPVAVDVTPVVDGATVLFATADHSVLNGVESMPKGVSRHGLHIGPDSDGGWCCSVKLDV